MARTGVSSLLRAAKSAQARQASLEDSIASYEFDLSTKDQAAYEKYSNYINKRINLTKNSDPIKAINYEKTLTSANRSFSSSEINRATTQVMYGNIDDNTKLRTMTDLYQRAIMNGDENLAQRIESQSATLQNKIISASMRGSGGGGGGGGGGSDSQLDTSVNNTIAQLKDDLSFVKNSFKSSGNKALGEIDSSRPEGGSIFSTYKGAIENIANTYRAAADQATNPNQRQKYLEKYNAIISGETKFDIGFANGNKSLNQINNYIQQRSLGNNITRVQMGPQGAKLVETKISGFSKYYKDPEGKIGLAPTQTQKVDANYERAVKRAESNLKKFNIKSSFNNEGYIQTENQATGQQIIGTVDPYGNILYQGVDDQGNPIVKRFVTSENKDEVVSQQEQQAIAASGNAIDTNRNVLDTQGEIGRKITQTGLEIAKGGINNPFGRNVSRILQNKVFRDVGSKLGEGDFAGAFGAFAGGGLDALGNLGRLETRMRGQLAEKKARDLEQARVETERVRNAAAESAQIVQQQRAAEEAARQKSVVFKAPTIDYNKILDPYTRAGTAINEQLRPSFGKNLYDLNRFR